LRIGILIFLISVFVLQAQTLTILDKENSLPLEAALIYTTDKTFSAVTNRVGQVDISTLLPDQILNIEYIGLTSLHLSVSDLSKLNFVVRLEPAPFKISEITISASRWQQEKSLQPVHIASVERFEAGFQNPQTAADLLGISGQVFIQKSQMGGGSPMIRGFAANRVLMAVDGVRMNTAIFRSGNLQNVISLDPLAIERTEVVFGPGSVMYGSDAISAVMSFFTLDPAFGRPGKKQIRTQATLRTASANAEKTGHADISIGFQKWAFLTSLTYSDYGDLTMGSNGPAEYQRYHYAARINGQDSTVLNKNPELQKPTAYHQVNLMQKIAFRPASDWLIDLGLHYSSTGNYSRYDRLLRYRGENLRSVLWNYGPQIWMMNVLRVHHQATSRWYDEFNGSIAYQFFEESRHDRDFGKTELRHRTEKVDVYSLNLDFKKPFPGSRILFYGFESLWNTVTSGGEDEDISTGISVAGPSRYSDGSTWDSYAIYANYQQALTEQLLLQTGLRYNQVVLDAQFDHTFYDFPFSKVRLTPRAFIGSLGLNWQSADDLVLSLNLSSGFRSPNIDDIGKVFDSEPGSVVVPNPDLKPEYAWNLELGFSKTFADRLKMDGSVYYTLLDQAMVRRDFTLNGQDSIVYDGEPSQVQAIQNAAEARVYGFEAGVELKITPMVSILSRFNYQKGEEELDDGSTAPLRHAGPWFGDTHLKWSFKNWLVDGYAVYNGSVKFKDLAPEEQSKDYMYAIDDNGNPWSPSWYTLNLKAQYRFLQHYRVNFGVENISDQRYRPYSSGLAGAGRNFILALSAGF